MDIRIKPGSPFPLGATWDGQGVNFALYAENASGVELCLFDSKEEHEESRKIKIEESILKKIINWELYLRLMSDLEAKLNKDSNEVMLLWPQYNI